MQITNSANLPEPLVRAVSFDRKRYPGWISVTELIQPPQIRALMGKFGAELAEDASDRIWALLGTLLHQKLAGHAENLEDHVAEERLSTKVLGWTVSGQFDLAYRDEVLTDYKLTSVWSVKEGIKSEWEQQINVYAELLRRHGRHVNQLQVVSIGRDWSKNKAKYDSTYPQQQVKVFSVPLWTPEQANDFLEERVKLHQEAEKGNWPECTPDERWVRDTKFAVMKQGQKKAVRLYATKEQADSHAYPLVAHYVVERPGESVRCESYCAVASVCPQRQRELGV